MSTTPTAPSTGAAAGVAIAIVAARRAGVVFNVSELLAERNVEALAVFGAVLDLAARILAEHPGPDRLLAELGLDAALGAEDSRG